MNQFTPKTLFCVFVRLAGLAFILQALATLSMSVLGMNMSGNMFVLSILGTGLLGWSLLCRAHVIADFAWKNDPSVDH